MENLNFVFGKKKKAWFAKNKKNFLLGMKLKASFSKMLLAKNKVEKWVPKRT
jgi:hypothetical protein